MIIGIDLGTTNSLVAYFTEDGPKLIPNRLGKYLTPSVVSIDEKGEVYVGDTAKEQMLLSPECAASVFKRDMGTDRKFTLRHNQYSAVELSSFVLRSLKEDAETYLKEKVDHVIISVPAYFNDKQRRATKQAGEMAGFCVERIISEPTAAAIAYGLYESDGDEKFLVFDLGGGTFDVTILDRFDTIMEVHAIAGDNFLGGEDFTKILENMFYSHFDEINRDKLTVKEQTYIHKQAEICKYGFCNQTVSKFCCWLQNKSYEFEITMADYEKACENLLERIRKPIKQSLADAQLKLSEINRVILVGGATKLPIIRRFVARIFGFLPGTDVNPDEAVALGAAIQAAMKERVEEIKEIVLTDVCPFTLSTEVVVPVGNGRYEGGHVCPIIERNTTIPASRTERLYTISDDQTKMNIDILQGESRFAANNLLLGQLVIPIPKNKAGKESVDVTYTYDVNSILEVEATVISTQQKKRMIIKNQGNDLSDEEIEQRLQELSYLKIPKREEEKNKYLLMRGERMYEESIGEERLMVESAIQEFERALESQDNETINAARRKYEEALNEIEKEL